MISRPLLILFCGCTLAGPVVAGSLNAPAAPDAAGSAMYTLQDLYNRLYTGVAGVLRPVPGGVFMEPAAGPGSTMHTLTEIMNMMPAKDANGATTAQVLSGKKFWGLANGAWGLQTGSMATQTVNNATTSQNAGYYNAFNLATVDSDLAATNIKSGVTIFGVAGAYSGGTTSAPFPVAKTGQTTAYAAGDDGTLQKGVAWPNPRFTDNLNGAVTDNLTGLVWLKNANCDGAKQWAAAVTWAASLKGDNTVCSLKDGSVAGQWRLPTIKELSSLVNAGASNPALPTGYPFASVQSYFYWSSTALASDTSSAWLVNLIDGGVLAGGKTNDVYVWPVRGGQ